MTDLLGPPVMRFALDATIIKLQCRWRRAAHRPLFQEMHNTISETLVHVRRHRTDPSPLQRHCVPFPVITAGSLTHALRQSMHLMLAAQHFIFSRCAGLGLNLAAYAQD